MNKRQQILWVIVGSLIITTTACTTPEKANFAADQERVDRQYDYANLLEHFSKGESLYEGFYNSFQYEVTLLNSKMMEAQLHKKAGLQLWDAEKLETERTRKFQEMASRTEVFLSFFSPIKGMMNLDDKKSVWRTYLDVDGRRYIGEIKKAFTSMPDIVALYPYFNRWSKAYVIIFPVPTSVVEKHEAKFTITGSLGTSTVTFPPE